MTCGIQMLLGGGSPTIQLAANYNASSTIAGSTATAQFELSNAGDVRLTNPNNTVNDVGDWITPKTGMGSYEAMMTVNSGSALTGSATATWLNLGTTRNWQLVESVVGILSSNCTVQIRNATSLLVLATSAVTVIAERT